MMVDIRGATLACTLVACVALVVLHALTARAWLAGRPQTSPQKVTALLGVVLNIPLAMGVLVSGISLKVSSGELLLACLYALLAFNSVAYSYFHFFNLSETGRRIRMLLQLLEGEDIANAAAGAEAYNGKAMVEQRLVRLSQMGQLRQVEGRYVIGGRFLLNAARLVRAIGQLSTGRAQTSSGRGL